MPSFKYSPQFTIVGLERELRTAEATDLAITAIDVSSTHTVGTFADGVVPLRSLALWVDPTGTATGPRDSTLICRGKAYLSGAKQAVAVAAFRKG